MTADLSRRTALAGSAALAATASLPPTAALAAPGPAPRPALPPRWTSATAEELAGFVGARFRARTETGAMVLKLVEIEPHRSGPARPGDLPRREAVTAVFDGPDTAALVAAGGGMLRLSHPRIGTADLYAVAVPRRVGGHRIEIVLN